jgi:hypothetical protein
LRFVLGQQESYLTRQLHTTDFFRSSCTLTWWRNSSPFMQPESSLLCSVESTTIFYPELAESQSHRAGSDLQVLLQNVVRISQLPHMSCTFHSYHLPWFRRPSNNSINYEDPLLLPLCLSFRPKCFPQWPILISHPHTVYPLGESPDFIHMQNRNDYCIF